MTEEERPIEQPKPLRPVPVAPASEGWWAGCDEEFMNIGGPFATRDEAIAAGRAYLNGDPFWICHAVLHCWYAPDASCVFDELCNQSDEYFYEDGFPGFDGGKEAERAAGNDLQVVLNEWIGRHTGILPKPTAFANCSDHEQIDAPEAATGVELGGAS